MVENINTKTFWKKAGEKQKQQKSSLCMDIPAKIPKNNVTDTKRVKNKEDYDDDEKENENDEEKQKKNIPPVMDLELID